MSADRELFFENTPLENLRSILSDADASAKTTAVAQPVPSNTLCISKTEIKAVADRLAAEPQQFFTPDAIRQLLMGLMRAQEPGHDVFGNKHVLELENIVSNKF